jgi:uncharacterized cupin superfamily protein
MSAKGLISQIENSRTIPSLIVLIDIIKALDIDLNVFFKYIRHKEDDFPLIIRRKNEYEHFEKEDAKGFNYQRIFTQSIKNSTIDIVILELDQHASRPHVETDAYEYKYIIKGQVSYYFGEAVYILNEGDSMLFDGRVGHTPKNTGNGIASMLVMYIFEGKA